MITTPEQLAARIGVPKETLAIAVQTIGIKEFLRHMISEHGAMNICGSENGKVVRFGEMFEKIYGEGLDGKKRRAKR